MFFCQPPIWASSPCVSAMGSIAILGHAIASRRNLDDSKTAYIRACHAVQVALQKRTTHRTRAMGRKRSHQFAITIPYVHPESFSTPHSAVKMSDCPLSIAMRHVENCAESVTEIRVINHFQMPDRSVSAEQLCQSLLADVNAEIRHENLHEFFLLGRSIPFIALAFSTRP
jgi:hypothetical protein